MSGIRGRSRILLREDAQRSGATYDLRVESRSPWTMSHRGQVWFDRVLVVLLLCLVGLAWVGQSASGLVLVALLGQVVPLLWRRRRPGTVLAVVAAASFLQACLSRQMMPTQVAVPIVAYSAARWGTDRVKAAAVVLTLLGSVVASWVWLGSGRTDLRAFVIVAVLCATTAMAAWAFGIAASQRDRHLSGLVDRAEYLQRVADRDVALAAQDERARIAREMHDVVAHGLSVIVVQSDGARYAAAKNPEVAVQALETISATGRESLQEMRRLLGVLRTGDSGIRPQPTLADVPHLVDEAAAAGTDVTARIDDPLPHVSEGVGLAVYRFVQEGLTNVRKHAGPGVHAEVRVGVVNGALVAEVLDDGRGAAAAQGSAGLGLLGMRERIGVHDGQVTAGPRPGGGWVVSARIPL